MKNQMNCIQSDPYQRTLHIKVKQTQRLLLGVGILLLSTIASQAQSLLPSASKPDPSKNQKSIQLGDNHYRVVPVGQYGKQASQTDSMVAQATENKTESKRPLFQQAFIQNDLGTQNSIALTQCETCEPASAMTIRSQLVVSTMPMLPPMPEFRTTPCKSLRLMRVVTLENSLR